MEIFNGYKACIIKQSVIAIGNFDGLHLAHQAILDRLLLLAKKFKTKSAVYTFNPHPVHVLNPGRLLFSIDSREEKIKRISNYGVDFIIDEPFIENFKSISSEKFVQDILISHLDVKGVVVGENYHFGQAKKGNIVFLSKKLNQSNVCLEVVNSIRINGTVCSF